MPRNKRAEEPIQRASKIKQLFLMKSVIAEQYRIDPTKFKNDLSERVKNAPMFGKIAQSVILAAPADSKSDAEVNARLARETGEISRAIQILVEGNAAPELRRHYESELARLQQPFVQSLPLASVNKVLHFITNSLPHTNSGYSLRSHAVLKAMQSVGIASCAATRIGYPAVVGRFSEANPECVDGVDYYRLLPQSMSCSLEKQQETAIEQLIYIARETGAEAIHTTTGFENALIASRAAMVLEIPWVYEMRGEPERTWLSKKPHHVQHVAKNSEYFRLAHRQEFEAAKMASGVVVLSNIMKKNLVDRGIDERKIFVVPNGVNDNAFFSAETQSESRKELGLPVDKKIVGAITAVVDYEGLEYLIDAIEQLDESYIGLIVGDGVVLDDLVEKVERQGLSSRIIFVGRQSNATIAKWYRSLDVFVVPRKNTLVCQTVTPIKTVMAQALNVPVVASDLPALREVTGELEYYVEPENADALATGIEAVLAQSNIENGGERVEWADSRKWSVLANTYKELYQGTRN